MQRTTGTLLSRRTFASVLGAGLTACGVNRPKPNILWITCEDIGPHLGCYGDTYATTPNIDKLAAKGMIYKYAWSTAPVCAPARTTLISGLYPPSTGSEHMRSETRLPEGMLMYPCYLREAGYYASNNSKEDFNLAHTGKVWDESSNKAHWRNREPGQPFFSIFNFTITHESQIRRRPHTLVNDPAKVRVPAYHPDTPEVRHDWAQYYDNITTMDTQAGEVLQQLEADGLADDTIVVFYGDHGSGMPRSKRWPYNSGLHVGLVVYIPDKYRHLAPPEYKAGGASERPVGFIDLAPTVLSLAGVRPPEHMHGYAFLGEHIASEQPYIYGFRGRMDERYDMVRSVRDKRYIYIRNYMPHKIYGQHIAYMFETPTTQVWKRLYDQGKLNAAQRKFWERKPPEELYDLENDPDEVNNLVDSPEHQPVLERMRKAQRDLALRIRDIGFLPEDEIHSRAKDSTPYEVAQSDGRYPLQRVMETAELASSLKPDVSAQLVEAMADPDSAVRYWGALGLLMRGEGAVKSSVAVLRKALDDGAPSVRIVAAEALGLYGERADLEKAMAVLLDLAPADRNGLYVSLQAMNAIESFGKKAAPWKQKIAAVPRTDPNVPQRINGYVPRLAESILERL